MEFRLRQAALLFVMIKCRPDVPVIISGRRQTRTGLVSQHRQLGVLNSRVLGTTRIFIAIGLFANISFNDVANKAVVSDVVAMIISHSNLAPNVVIVKKVETIDPALPIVRLPPLCKRDLGR